MRDQAQTLMPIDEVQERVREAVHAHFYTLANLFKEIDYANIGVISKEDFRDVMDKNVMRFTDEQVCWPGFINTIYRYLDSVFYHYFRKVMNCIILPFEVPIIVSFLISYSLTKYGPLYLSTILVTLTTRNSCADSPPAWSSLPPRGPPPPWTVVQGRRCPAAGYRAGPCRGPIHR